MKTTLSFIAVMILSIISINPVHAGNSWCDSKGGNEYARCYKSAIDTNMTYINGWYNKVMNVPGIDQAKVTADQRDWEQRLRSSCKTYECYYNSSNGRAVYLAQVYAQVTKK